LLLTLLDSTAGASAEEMVTQQAAIDSRQPASPMSNHPKPSVVSRSVWCLDSRCDYTDGIYYSPTTHLIVHHTAGSNHPLDYDWPSVVRAIWYYHAITRDWGDIGYNYLVDPNGVLYEGHIGGDDVVGTHASGANTGSMALSFMGNFTYLTPYDPMLNSAINLFAWKADQKNINVFDAREMPYLDWGLPNLSGHRDVYGGTNTECPGEALHELVPWLQQEVANAIGFVDPAIYVDEMGGAFAMSDPTISWFDSPSGCGNMRHGYYTFSVTNPDHATNWGEWTLDVPTNGRYQLDAYIPFCTTGTDETGGATYDIDHANGHSVVTVSQQAEVGLWISLGEFDLLASDDGLVRLTDLTTTDEDLGVWYDALRLVPVDNSESTAVNTIPTDESWTANQLVDFEWALTNPENIITVTLQAATDINFTQIITETEWQTAVYSHTIPFTQDYAAVHWRIQLDLTNGNQFISDSTHFGIDSTPPTSTITSLTQPDNVTYVITLEGHDALIGLDTYNVDYRETGNTTWTTLISNTTSSMITTQLPIINQTYEFRSQALDLLGNIEPPHDTPDAISTLPSIATAVNIAPTNGSWTTNQLVDFEWGLTNPENIITVTLQTAMDAEFTQMITETEWETAVSSHTIPFSEYYAVVHWRVQLDLTDGSQFVSDSTHFGMTDVQLINGSFEDTDGWTLPFTAIPAAYNGEQVHGGLHSMRIGLTDTMTQTYGYSSVQQTITLPDGSWNNIELRAALYTLAGEEEVAMQAMREKTAVSAGRPSSLMDIETATLSGDLQYILLLDPTDGSILATLYWGLWNEQAWQEIVLPIPSSLAGQEVVLHFGVKNDGENGRAGMYVDDVSLWLSSSYQLFLPTVVDGG